MLWRAPQHSLSTSQAARLVLDEFEQVPAARPDYWLSAGRRSEAREWAMAGLNSVSHLRRQADELKELTDQLVTLLDSWLERVQDRDHTVGRAVEVRVNAFPLPMADDSARVAE